MSESQQIGNEVNQIQEIPESSINQSKLEESKGESAEQKEEQKKEVNLIDSKISASQNQSKLTKPEEPESGETQQLTQSKLQATLTPEVIQQRQDAIQLAYIDRKKQSFQVLKTWEKGRMDFLKHHKMICDNILYRLDKKIGNSVDSIEKV